MTKKTIFCAWALIKSLSARTHFKIVLATFLILNASIKSQTVNNLDWVKFYSQTGTVQNYATDLDGNNNVYVVGYVAGTTTVTTNMVTLKYDSLGNQLWASTYNNGGYDAGTALKVDASGNVYSTGKSDGSTSNKDYVTMKYNSSGAVQWTSRFNGAGNGYDEAVDLKVKSGNVFVVGKATNGSGNFDIVTLMYNSSGTLQWSNYYNGAAAGADAGVALTLSSDGAKVFVTGNTTNGSGNTDIVTYAIAVTTGTTIWSTITSGSAGNNDNAAAITLSGANVVITGMLNNTTSGQDYTTIKYNGSTGAIIWQESYDNSNGSNKATALVRDSTGNIGVTGVNSVGGIYEYHTVLYDSLGNQLWVNKTTTNLSTVTVDPKIATDTIANHFYISGECLRASRDIFAYQITPGGNTTWKQYYDNSSGTVDAATNLLVNGLGVVYLSGLCKNANANMYDLTTLKISQTPVYFPPDLSSVTEQPNVNHLYYENRGQIVNSDSMKVNKDILFSTMDFYPNTFFTTSRISYKFKRYASASGQNDSTQRVDIQMLGTNGLAVAYPFNPVQGHVSVMYEQLPNAVTGIQGYERYFIPNIYPDIDLQYYSNGSGLKLYYILKPQADPKNIIWQINGSKANSLVSGKLQINSFSEKVTIDQPIIYTVNMSGAAVSVTTPISWQSIGSNKYNLSIGTYSTNWPYVIEVDYGNASPTTPGSINNLQNSTYYGGWTNDGFKCVDVDQNTGNYVVIGQAYAGIDAHVFPVISSSLVSTSLYDSTTYFGLTMVVFDQNGTRKAVNTYAPYKIPMIPMAGVINNDLITIVGNNRGLPFTANLPLINSSGPVTAGTYSNNNGYGWIAQFRYVPSASSINSMTWRTRVNGFCSDIAKTPDGKNLYVTNSTSFAYSPIDTKTVSGAFNYSALNPIGGSPYSFQISKFDSSGVRSWSTIFPALNSNYTRPSPFNSMNISLPPNLGSIDLYSEDYIKCKIACDKYGFSIAGSTDTIGLIKRNKYNVPIDTVFSSHSDAFFARFNKSDDLVYSTYVGGQLDDSYNDICTANSKESIMVGYSNSVPLNSTEINTLPGIGQTPYVDNQSNYTNCKMLITKFDTTGNKTWGTFYGFTATGTMVPVNIAAWAVASDQKGKTYVTGSDLGQLNIVVSNPPAVYSDYTVTASESFMLAFNDGLNYPVWNTCFGGDRKECGLGVAFNSKVDQVYQVGLTSTSYSIAGETPWFPITRDFNNPGNWFQFWLNTSAGALHSAYDGYISTFGTDVVTGIQEYFKDRKTTDVFNLFPNPTQNSCSLAFKNGIGTGVVKIEIFNQDGQLMDQELKDGVLPFAVINLSTSRLVSGIYIVRVSSDEMVATRKLIIAR